MYIWVAWQRGFGGERDELPPDGNEALMDRDEFHGKHGEVVFQ